MSWFAEAMSMLIPIVAIVATFTFVGVLVWAKYRRSERESYYRHELVKQMAEKAADEDRLLAFLREKHDIRQANRRQGLLLGGLITMAIGIGFLIGFRWLDDELSMVGAVPIAIGLALVVGALLLRSSK